MEELKKIFSAIAKTLLDAIIVDAVLSLAVMLLWNWLMPVLFGLPAITYLRAFGLMLLCTILFRPIDDEITYDDENKRGVY